MLSDELKTTRNIFTVFALVGLLIFLVGIVLCIKFIYVDVKNKIKTDATIVNIYDSSILVKYEYHNREYKKTFHVYSSNYYVGKHIKIFIEEARPYKAVISSFRFLSLIGPGIGIIFMGVGGIGYIYIYMKMNKELM